MADCGTPPGAMDARSHARPEGRGVDARYAYALGMLGQGIDVWPDSAVFLGDQIYADDSSPHTHERIDKKRKQTPNDR